MGKKEKFSQLICIVCISGLLPVAISLLVYCPSVNNFISNVLKTNRITFLEVIAQYLSISITLGLGIVVYNQSERINGLEASQYKLFLGVEDLDYGYTFGDCLASYQCEADWSISYRFSANRRELMTTVNFGTGQAKVIFLPLVFLTKNSQLITTLVLRDVSVSLKYKDDVVHDKIFTASNGQINTILHDGCRFVLGFGIVMPEANYVDEISLLFNVGLTDQHMRNTTIQIAAQLLKSSHSDEFALISSRSKCL